MSEIDSKSQVINIIKAAITKHLPNVKPEDLEENGKVYYMNDQNGTIFDWTMNNHASSFMCFYNDGMGAAKANFYSDGKYAVYLYDATSAHKFFAEENGTVGKNDVLSLTCFLYFNADKKGRFGMSLDDLNYVEPSEPELAEFEDACVPKE